MNTKSFWKNKGGGKKTKKLEYGTFKRLHMKDLKLKYYKMGNTRCELLNFLEKNGVQTRILEPIKSIPREFFVELKYFNKVYKNQPIPIGHKQVTNQPSLICEMIKLCEFKPEHNVLEIGSGTGYNSSIISKMVKHITTIEHIEALAMEAKKIFDVLKFKKILGNNITIIYGDGSKGYLKNAPYDRIIFTAGNYGKVPDGVDKQLKEGEILIIPIRLFRDGKRVEHIYKYVKKRGKIEKFKHSGVHFVPLKSSNVPLKDITMSPKDFSGIVNGRDLNELYSHFIIGNKRCQLYKMMENQKILPKTLEAFKSVPREMFMPFLYIEKTYNNRPHPIGYDQTISQPSLVAKMIDFLKIKPTDNVLEIGTGYGYHSSLISLLCKHITTMDIVLELVEGAREVYNFLIKNGILKNNILVLHGDGYQGYPEKAPYNKILVTCGAQKKVPDKLIEQLSPNGGICVIPIKNRKSSGVETLYRYTKNGSKVKEEELMGVRFVPFKKNDDLKTKIID